MTDLITGPTGAVGQYVLEQILVSDAKVRVLALPETLHRLPYRNQIEVIPGALEDDDALADALKDVEVVYHTAIMSPPPFRAPEEMERLNTQGTRRLLEACAGTIRRFVLVSSVNVYTPHRTPDTWPVRADADRLAHGNAQLTAFGQTMIDAEDFLFEASARYGLEYTILRPTTVCGRSSRFSEMVISDLMRNPARAEQTHNMWGTMQWIHGSDVGRAALLASHHAAARNEEFLLAGKEAITSFSLLADLWTMTHQRGEPNPFTEGAEANRPPLCKFDTLKIKDALGFEAQIPVRQCLAEMLGKYEFYTSAGMDLPKVPNLLEFELDSEFFPMGGN